MCVHRRAETWTDASWCCKKLGRGGEKKHAARFPALLFASFSAQKIILSVNYFQNPFPRGRILSLIDRNYYSQKVSFRYQIAHRAGSGKKSPSRNSKKPSAARQSPSSSTFQSTSPFSTQRQPNSSRVTGSEIPDPGKTRPISASTRFASRIVSRNPPPPGSVREFASMMTVARKSEREQR